MRFLAEYMMRGRIPAAVVISLCTFASWFLPPLTYLMSGAPVGLLTLRRGGPMGAQVIAVSFLMISVLAYAVNISPLLGGSFAIGVWAPVWLCSLALRYTELQGMMVLAAAGIGILFAVSMYWMVDDVAGWWRSWFFSWLEANLPPDAADSYQKLLETVVPWLNALMASALVAILVVTVLVARWWQARVFNPGGFRREFHGLRLPRPLALPAMLGIVVLTVLQWEAPPPARDVLVIVFLAFVFPGIAAVHRTVYGRSLSRAWLVGMYGLLVLMPQLFLFLSCMGMADSWLGRRASTGEGPGAR